MKTGTTATALALTALMALSVALTGATTAAAQERETPPLQWDPFAAPDARQGPGSARKRSSLEVWEPVLRATLSGGQGLADLGGIVLEVGEAANGYRLLAVRTFEADFEDPRGEIVTLALEGSPER